MEFYRHAGPPKPTMISVITITYNRAGFLKEAIDSVLSQSYADLEHIIVDDGSTDDTSALLKTYTDPRIVSIRCAHSGHLSSHKNLALAKARGSVVAFLDSDDLWHTDYLKEIMQVYTSEKVSSVITNAFVVAASGTRPLINKRIPARKGDLLTRTLKDDNFILCTCSFSCLASLPLQFDTGLKCGENDFYLRALSLGPSYYLPKELSYIRRHDSNMTNSNTYDSPFIQAYEEEFKTLAKLRLNKQISVWLYRRMYSLFLYRQALNLHSIGMQREAKAGYLRAYLFFPLRIRSLIRYLAG